VYVSFSGGKDSTVLADMYARFCEEYGCKMYLCFVNTGLEYPEIQKFVKTFAGWLQNTYNIEVELTILRPKMRFDEVISKYGYPFISTDVSLAVEYAKKGSQWAINNLNGLDNKGNPYIFKKSMYSKYKPLLYVDFNISSRCCGIMKEKSLDDYQKKCSKVPFVATMANESKRRENGWLAVGCNAFDSNRPMSKPLSFWTEQDILKYIKQNNLELASVYGDIVCENDGFLYANTLVEDGCKYCTTGEQRTGCIFCGFSAHLDKGESRFERLKRTHPKQYDYCMNGGDYDENGIWVPTKEGLGMAHCIDEINKIYGKDFIKY
jgi:3'-phosphoadenosine 5'-phosphosulfate sulfotransferase (PAPS reductase)/FAD synthetase